MPSHNTHCAVSNKRTGFDFAELHKWIDSPKVNLTNRQRMKRHAYNEDEASKIKDFWDAKMGTGWGDTAVAEWLFHIALDNLENAFKHSCGNWSADNVYNFLEFGLCRSGYIHCDFAVFPDDDLKSRGSMP